MIWPTGYVWEVPKPAVWVRPIDAVVEAHDDEIVMIAPPAFELHQKLVKGIRWVCRLTFIQR